MDPDLAEEPAILSLRIVSWGPRFSSSLCFPESRPHHLPPGRCLCVPRRKAGVFPVGSDFGEMLGAGPPPGRPTVHSQSQCVQEEAGP